MNDNKTLILGKELKMDEEFCADAIKRYGELIREETAEKVRKETEERVAREMIENGFEIEDIVTISHLDLKTVKQLINIYFY